jgi:hypothetical protein
MASDVYRRTNFTLIAVSQNWFRLRYRVTYNTEVRRRPILPSCDLYFTCLTFYTTHSQPLRDYGLLMPWYKANNAFEKQEVESYMLSKEEYEMRGESELIVNSYERKLKFQED